MRRNLLLLIAAGLLAGLLYAESLAGGTASRWLVLAFKTPLSILFVVTAWLQPRVMPRYFKIVLIGLILGLVGDVVISGMVAGAWAAFRNSAVPRAGAWFILIGAVLFYASDIFVAHQRFVMEHFYNRLIGLPLYYTGQFLLAFSVGLVKKDPLHPR